MKTSLSSSKAFEKVNKVQNIVKVIAGLMQPYIVDIEHYDILLKAIKSFKYPLKKQVYEACTRGLIKPIMLADPAKTSDEPKLFPTSIFSFIKKDEEGRVAAFVDMSSKAKYIRERKDDIPYSLKVNGGDLTFYQFVQSAYINLVMTTNPGYVAHNTRFIKNYVNAYAKMVTRCLDKTFSFGSSMDMYDSVFANVAYYVLRVHFDYEHLKAIKLIETYKIVTKDILYGQCQIRDHGAVKKMETIEDLFSFIESEVPNYVRVGDLTVRSFIAMFTKMYGQNTIFAIEHPITFVCTLALAPLRSDLVNHRMINNITAKETKEIVGTLSDAYGKHISNLEVIKRY